MPASVVSWKVQRQTSKRWQRNMERKNTFGQVFDYKLHLFTSRKIRKQAGKDLSKRGIITAEFTSCRVYIMQMIIPKKSTQVANIYKDPRRTTKYKQHTSENPGNPFFYEAASPSLPDPHTHFHLCIFKTEVQATSSTSKGTNPSK